MVLLGYGEDSLTLWAIKNHLEMILEKVEDDTPTNDCIVYFRPSFGIIGGSSSAQFGEFDFIIISSKCVYLGESKWDNSSELKGTTINLRKEQLLRHKLFNIYIRTWIEKKPQNWQQFSQYLSSELKNSNINKKVAPFGSLLQKNIHSVLTTVSDKLKSVNKLETKNILLYLYNSASKQLLPKSVNSTDFTIVCIDYSTNINGQFIKM